MFFQRTAIRILLYRLIATFTFFFVTNIINAKDDIINRHFIVLTDAATSGSSRSTLVSDATRHAVYSEISSLRISAEDYVSIVSYGIDIDAPDFSKFVTVAYDSIDRAPVKWRKVSEVGKDFKSLGRWASMSFWHHRNEYLKESTRCGHLTSLAKQYALKMLCSEGLTANETYFIIVATDAANGLNPSQELENISNFNLDVRPKWEPIKNKILSFSTDVNSKFSFERKSSKLLENKSYQPLKLEVYKVSPSHTTSIQAATDIPATLPFVRVKGGYSVDIHPKVISGDYQLIGMEVETPHESFYSDLTTGKGWTEKIAKDKLYDGEEIKSSIWLKYQDGIYNGFMMSPNSNDYKSGLNSSQRFHLQNDAKIFGHVPMEDSWYWRYENDVNSSVKFWEFLSLIVGTIFVVSLIIYTYIKLSQWLKTYIPDNKDIEIKKQ